MMKKWLQEIFDKKKTIVPKEWRTEDSIFQFLSANLNQEGELSENAMQLPDEVITDDIFQYEPGFDDARSGPDNSEDALKRVAELAKHLKRIALYGDPISEHEFYRILNEQDNISGIMDSFIETIQEDLLPVDPFLFNYAKDLATKSNTRNAVKFGITLLCLCHNKSVLPEIKILGLHDEFTFYSGVAITGLSHNPEHELWELAKKVHGWGRIRLVDLISQRPLTGPVKEWLIYEGYKNRILYEYIACTCAVCGDLHERLDKKEIGQELFNSASDIISALLYIDWPTANISDYPFAATLLQDFIRHSWYHSNNVRDFSLLHRIKEFLTKLQDDPEGQTRNGWNQDIISNCLIDTVQLLNSKDWQLILMEGLKSNDDELYLYAKEAAEKLGVDLWDTFWARLQEQPLNPAFWEDVTGIGRPEHAEEIIEFAMKQLPLEELGTGAEDKFSVVNNARAHECMVFVTIFLVNYPKMGEKILLTALRSPLTYIRDEAVSVLEKWKKENWSSEIEQEIRQLSRVEPDPDTKKNIKKLLRRKRPSKPS